MSDSKIESLSALMDGEVDELAIHRTLKDIDNSSELKDTWSRYHIGSDAIKGTLSEFSHLDISAAVSSAIDNEKFDGDVNASNKGWLKAVGGLSIAASVTFAVVLGARFNPLVDTSADQQFASKTKIEVVTPEQTPQKGRVLIAQGKDSVASPDLNEAQLEQAQERLNAYLKQHAQDSAFGQGRTAMPFARVVNFETTNENKGN